MSKNPQTKEKIVNIFQRLFESRINFEVYTLFDAERFGAERGFVVRVGTKTEGVVVATWEEVAPKLKELTAKQYPAQDRDNIEKRIREFLGQEGDIALIRQFQATAIEMCKIGFTVPETIDLLSKLYWRTVIK